MSTAKSQTSYSETSVEKAVTEPKITAQFTGDNLYDVISEICRLTGLGFKVTLNDKKQFVFKLYAGADRTFMLRRKILTSYFHPI